MKTVNNTSLSLNAQQLLSALLQRPLREDQAIEVLYPKPVYGDSRESKIAYWQWDANLYGTTTEWGRPVGNGESMVIAHTDNYRAEVCAAFQELRRAGLADERNNGYNDYTFFAKG